MDEQRRIAKQIFTITKLDPISFEKQLKQYYHSEFIFLVFADLLASNLPYQQKLLAASGINCVINYRLDVDFRQWPVIWEQLYKDILLHPQVDKMQWRHLSILAKGLQKLMDDFGEQLCNVINPIFDNLNLKGRVLVYQAFLAVQTTKETRYIFLRQTIQSYSKEIYHFVCWMHDQSNFEKDNLKMQEQMLSNLAIMFTNLQRYLSDDYINGLMVSLGLNDDLFLLIVQQLLFDSSKSKYVSLSKQQFSVQRMKELVLVSESSSPQICQHINTVKSQTIEISLILLSQYDKKSQLQAFDHYKHLHFMQNFTPIVADKLTSLVTQKKITTDNQNIAISLLSYLCLACKFNFLSQFFDSNLQQILFQIVFPLFRAQEQQIQEFNQNDQQFVLKNEKMVEQVAQIDDRSKTIKNGVSDLLQQIVRSLDGSLMFVIETNLSLINFVLKGTMEEQLIELTKKFNFELSLQASLSILTLFSQSYLNRRDLLITIKNKLLDHPQINKLEKLDLARLFIFLAYNYESIYEQNQEEGIKFVIMAANQLQSQTALSRCALLLFQNCITLGFGKQIWNIIISKIITTKSTTIFGILQNIVSNMLSNLPLQYLGQMIQKVIERIIIQFRVCEIAAGSCQPIKGNSFIFKCFNILQQISQNAIYIKDQPATLDFLWPIFDLFEFTERIQFEDNILKIFNNLLQATNSIEVRFYHFLQAFPNYHFKHQGFDETLLKTYTMLLVKGSQLFLRKVKEWSQLLQKVLTSLKECYSSLKKEESLKYFCIFYHFAYTEYSTLLQKDTEMLSILYNYYQENRQTWQCQTLASVLNLFVVAEINYGGCNMNIIKENNIYIFKGYQAKMLSLGLRRLIEKYCQSDKVLDYLRYSIRLLHYVRQAALEEIPGKKGYYVPHFVGLKEVDPFIQICGALDYLKRNIEVRRYDGMIEQLSGEITLGQIKDLLSRRIIDKSVRTIIKVKSY